MNKIGIDLVFMPRLMNRITDENFLNKVLTTNELKLFDNLNNDKRKLEFLSGRFACKEAYAKALKLGIGKIDFKDIEILYDENGAPCTNLENVEVSISHDNEYAVAIIQVGEINE